MLDQNLNLTLEDHLRFTRKRLEEDAWVLSVLESRLPGVFNASTHGKPRTIYATGGPDVLLALQKRLPMAGAELHIGKPGELLGRIRWPGTTSKIFPADTPFDPNWKSGVQPIQPLFGTVTEKGQRHIRWFSTLGNTPVEIAFITVDANFSVLFSEVKTNRRSGGNEHYYFNVLVEDELGVSAD